MFDSPIHSHRAVASGPGRWVCAVACAVLVLSCVRTVWGETNRVQSTPIEIDFFFEPGCDDCFQVRTRVLPRLAGDYPGTYALREHDLGVDAGYLRLVQEMERLGVEDNAHVYILVNRNTMLAGLPRIETELFPLLDAVIASGGEPPVVPAVDEALVSEKGMIEDRVDKFTLLGVILGGLADGINPCAISTLVFLISVLTMSKVRGAHLLAIGGVFCVASFLTYSAIGFGLLRALHLLSCFQTIKNTVDAVLVAILIVLAVMSLVDALRFRSTQEAAAVSLRLPERFSIRIHAMLRKGLGKRAQVTTAFGLGCAVTAIESVCTGQVYVPTLALVVKRGTNVSLGLFYLGLYNLMFIVPLVVVLLLTYRGLELFRLIEWSRQNVVTSKILMSLFFVGLAVLILFL